MAYNVWLGAGMEPGHAERGSNMNRLDDLITLVKQADPDILGLEELNGWTAGDPTIIEQFATAINMNYYLAPTWRGFNIGLFTKFPILETENISEYVGNNGALRAVVQTPDGRKMNVVIVHLDPTDAALRACEFDKLRIIMSAYQANPSVLMGDINTFPHSAEAVYLNQGGWLLVKSETIDDIFVLTDQDVSAKNICISADKSTPNCILDTGISDHKPVAAALSFYDSKNLSNPTLPATFRKSANCNYERAPAELPNDNFNGTKLDDTKWRSVGFGGSVSEDGRLIPTTSNEAPSTSAKIQSKWQLRGDFDIQVDFHIDESWIQPVTDHLDGAYFGVNIDGQSYHITRLRRTAGGNSDAFFVWSTDGKLSGEKNTTAVAGKYRIIRTGTDLSFQYDEGAGWVELSAVTVAYSPAKVYLGNGTVNEPQVFTTYFVNFLINSGSAIY
jgi:endonuclease/exonuclease/phosphatase family metal-dependent hydrolase